MKILFLTKEHVVCAASHLATPFAYGLFRDNPVLLRRKLVLPALRSDKLSFAELLARSNLPEPDRAEIADFYEENVQDVVSWNLVENSQWFHNQFLSELRNEESVLRANLQHVSRKHLDTLVRKIESKPLLARDTIESAAARLKKSEREVLLNFRELLYHTSGARTVNCESTLPQEEYIDFSLADLQSRKMMLSEMQIFWKLFLELALETLHRRAIPMEVLDLLSFEDIDELRQPIVNSAFRSHYDALIKKSIAAVQRDTPDQVLRDIEELMAIRETLSDSFESVFQKELTVLSKRKAMGPVGALGKTTLAFGLGVAGFIPLLSIPAGIAGMSIETPALWVNVQQSFRGLRHLNDYKQFVDEKRAILSKSIQNSSIDGKTVLLDVVNLLADRIAAEMTI